MILNLLLLLVIFIPPSKWYLSKHHLFDPTMDQGVIGAFKAYNLKSTFSQAIAATRKTLVQFWKDCNIYD